MSGKHFIDKKPESMLDWIAIVCAGIAFYLLLNNLGYFLGGFGALMGILSPFFGGIVIAYILDPMVRFFHAKLLKYSKRWRWVAILLAYLVAVLLIVLLAWLVIPQIVNSIMTLFNNVPQYINGIQEMLLFVQGRYGVDLDRAIKMLDDSEAMLNEVYSLGKTALPQIMSTMGNVAGNFVNVFTAIASSIYMLADKEHLLHQLRTVTHALLPRRAAEQTLGAAHLPLCQRKLHRLLHRQDHRLRHHRRYYLCLHDGAAAGLCCADQRVHRHHQHYPGVRPVHWRGAQHLHPAAGQPHPGADLLHPDFDHPAV